MTYRIYHSANEYLSISDESDCREKLCILIYDDLDVEYQQENHKIVVHGIMYDFYLCRSSEILIQNLNSAMYCTTGYIESEYKTNLNYNKDFKVNIGDYCIIKETYKDENFGLLDRVVSFSSFRSIMKSGWIRRQNLLFLDSLDKDIKIEKCSCDE